MTMTAVEAPDLAAFLLEHVDVHESAAMEAASSR